MFCEEERGLKVRIIHPSSDEEILTSEECAQLTSRIG
jgi:hypothetical protein